jgi:hypothetical protein
MRNDRPVRRLAVGLDEGDVTPGRQAKLQSAIADVLAAGVTAEQHCWAEPASAKSQTPRAWRFARERRGQADVASARTGAPAAPPAAWPAHRSWEKSMSTKYFRTAALAFTLLAGTTAFALAQSSSKQSPSGATQMQNAPSQNGATTNGSPSGSDQMTPGQAASGQSPAGSGKSSQTSPSSSPSGTSAQQQQPSTSQPSNKSTQSTQPSKRSTTAAAPSGEKANLSSKQKTVIKDKIIDNKSAPRVSHVDFDVHIGVAVPTSIHLAPLPVEIVRIHPAWRSYVYFVYEDEVIIVNPHSHKIVEIITVS